MSDLSRVEGSVPGERPAAAQPPVGYGAPPYQAIPASPVPAPPQPNLASRPASNAQLATDQQPTNGAVVAVAWFAAVLTFGYMLPWAIAASRGKANHGAIAVVNLLVGWTIVGWIVALVMACQAHRVAPSGAQMTVVVAQNFGTQSWQQAQTPAGWYPSPTGPGRRYWDGSAWTNHYAP